MRIHTFIFLLLSCLLHVILSFPTQESSVTDEVAEITNFVTVAEAFEVNNPSHVDGVEVYQSDMLLTERQMVAKKTRKAIADENYRWTEGPDGHPLVPYLFQDAVDQNDVRAGLDHWMEHTCINFQETSNTDQPHLQFYIGGGCSSFVGMIYWKRDGNHGQQVSIGSGCNGLATVAHEVGHAMGFHHEQSRSNRDDYVTIIWDNIKVNRSHNFDKEVDENYEVLYDYSSVMHYGQYYFSNNDEPTIITKDPLAQGLIGTRDGLTHRDKLLANRMYNCTGKWLVECGEPSDPCLNEGYIGKNCTCICPPGTNGSNCEDIVEDYYANLLNPLSEKITTEKTIKIETTIGGGNRFIKWIVPSVCKMAIVTFTAANLYSGECQYQYLNVKTDVADIAGQMLCAVNVTTGLTLTSDSGIIITMYNGVTYSGATGTLWEADVTFEDISGCSATDPTTSQTSGSLTTMPGPSTSSPMDQSTSSPIDSSTSSPIEPSTASSGSSALEKLKNICLYLKSSFDLKIDF